MIHPFLLADNRHYSFYFFKNIIRRYEVCTWVWVLKKCFLILHHHNKPSHTLTQNGRYFLVPFETGGFIGMFRHLGMHWHFCGGVCRFPIFMLNLTHTTPHAHHITHPSHSRPSHHITSHHTSHHTLTHTSQHPTHPSHTSQHPTHPSDGVWARLHPRICDLHRDCACCVATVRVPVLYSPCVPVAAACEGHSRPIVACRRWVRDGECRHSLSLRQEAIPIWRREDDWKIHVVKRVFVCGIGEMNLRCQHLKSWWAGSWSFF